MNLQVFNHLAQLCKDVASTDGGSAFTAFWVNGDGLSYGVFHPGDGDRRRIGDRQLASLASLSEMVASAADATIASMARDLGESEDDIRLVYLHMKDKARACGCRVVLGG